MEKPTKQGGSLAEVCKCVKEFLRSVVEVCKCVKEFWRSVVDKIQTGMEMLGHVEMSHFGYVQIQERNGQKRVI